MKEIQKLGFKKRSKDVVKGVQSLWYAPTKEEFDNAVVTFLAQWDSEIPAYATYFRRNWLDRYHPEKWASYARADNAPSGIVCLLFVIVVYIYFFLSIGSGSAEGFHNRLNHNMPRKAMSLDKMVDYLASEDEYWRRLVGDPRLWAEKKTAHDESQERHRKKRRMLKHYIERGANPERSDVVDTCVISSDLLSSDETENDTVDANSSSPTTTTTIPANKPQKQRKPRKPNLTTPMHERCLKCRLYKFNEQCSLTMCKTCCIASPATCKYTHHRQAKVGARQPAVIASETNVPPTTLPVVNVKEQLEAIIQSKGEAFISYDRGTNSKRPRRIKPNAFSLGKEGELVHAYCYVVKDKRSFYLHHITRIEDHNWETINNSNNNATPPQSPQSPISISPPSSAGTFKFSFFILLLILFCRKNSS